MTTLGVETKRTFIDEGTGVPYILEAGNRFELDGSWEGERFVTTFRVVDLPEPAALRSVGLPEEGVVCEVMYGSGYSKSAKEEESVFVPCSIGDRRVLEGSYVVSKMRDNLLRKVPANP